MLLFFLSSFFVQPSPVSVPQIEENVLGTQEGSQEEDTIPIVLSVQEQTYRLDVPKESTVYEAMSLASKTSGLRFGGKDFGELGFFVEEINGVSQQYPMYWIYSINGKKSQVGVSQYKLQAGDVISWTYEHEE